MKQKIIQKWQQWPSENQIGKKHLKQNVNAIRQTKSPILTTEDLMGLSWIFV
jgi:hypothetical protein